MLLDRFGEAPDGVTLRDRPGAYGVVFGPEDRVAVVFTEGRLVLPGGGVDPGESLEEALHRELREEAGLQASIQENLGAAGQVAHFAGRWWLKHCHFFLCRAVALGAPLEAHHELRWLIPGEAALALHYGADRWALERARRACR